MMDSPGSDEETATRSFFASFRDCLRGGDDVRLLHDGIIGSEAEIDGPFGRKRLVYADYVASGRALRQIESFVLERILPYYANSHTEASFVGGMMTRLRRGSRKEILSILGGTEAHAVIFTGSGATTGINRLVHLWQVKAAAQRGERPAVLIGPYEHHSNILPWRESGAEVIEIPEASSGGPCLDALGRALDAVKERSIKIGAFSAASNVTGILTDVPAVTRLLKQAGALAVWDYAGAGPYVGISLYPAPDAPIDAIVMSPHKFIGGPGASGLLVLRRGTVSSNIPTFPGGGSVTFVSPWQHVYSDHVEHREEAGTPNVVGDLRTALCLIVKEHIGCTRIAERNEALCRRALAAWRQEERIELLGNLDCRRLPIFSFRLRDGKGGYVHHQLATRMLSDLYGIQARGGCACAGPYVHRLLNLDDSASRRVFSAIAAGHEVEKPGFVRLNLSYLATDEEVDFIIQSVIQIAHEAPRQAGKYRVRTEAAIFSPIEIG